MDGVIGWIVPKAAECRPEGYVAKLERLNQEGKVVPFAENPHVYVLIWRP